MFSEEALLYTTEIMLEITAGPWAWGEQWLCAKTVNQCVWHQGLFAFRGSSPSSLS